MSIRTILGTSTDIRDGWINLDIAALPGIAVVHALNCRPWPWEDASVDEINTSDVIQHLDNFMPIMEAPWRVLSRVVCVAFVSPIEIVAAVRALAEEKRGSDQKSFCKQSHTGVALRFA